MMGTTMSQQAEIDTFNRHGHAFWDHNGPYRTLHEINPTRLKLIERYIHLNGAQILDVGCGGGILSEAMATRGANVTGIDLSSSVLDAARTHAADNGINITYRQCDTGQLVREGQTWQHITCMEMLEHVVDPAAVIRDITKLLKPNGYAFFSTLNRNKKSFLAAIVAAEYLTRTVPRGTHDHSWFITPAELSSMIEHAGLRSKALYGMDYHPLLKTAHLSCNVDINYFLIAHKPA